MWPSPYTFLARQSGSSHLRQKSFAQRKEMTFNHRLKTLGKIVSLNCPDKEHNSGVGIQLFAVAKIIKKHFLAHLLLFLNV